MLTFFRRLRKSFFLANQARRYFLYAIGEIALVVIGILIALQINNWNEWRKERELEKTVLEDIKDNLVRNHALIEDAIKTIDEIDRSYKILQVAIRSKTPYSDTLSFHINQADRSGTFLFKLNMDGYQSLQSAGFNIIQNEALKDEILSLYEVTYGIVLTDLNFASTLWLNHAGWWKDYFYKSDLTTLIPLQADNLMSEKGFLSGISQTAFVRDIFKRVLEECLPDNLRVLKLIKEELNIPF